MANRRAERLEIAGVEGVSGCTDYFVFHGVAILRYAAHRRYDRNIGRRTYGNMADFGRYRRGDICV